MDLYVLRLSDSRVTRLTDTPSREESGPTWSPDGKMLAFVRGQEGPGPAGGGAIAVIPARGGTPRQLNTGPGNNLYPAWSPDGKWIVFVNDRHGPFDLYVIHPDSTGLRLIVRTAGAELHPSWSPDGRRLAYGRPEGLFVIGVNGRGNHQITNGIDIDPAWRPRA